MPEEFDTREVGLDITKLREQARESATAAATLRIVEPLVDRINRLERENAKLKVEIGRLVKPPKGKTIEAEDTIAMKDS